MDLSCVIPTFDRPDTLIMVLEGLSRQSYQGDYEVLVVDDGSSDSASKQVSVYMKEHLRSGNVSWRYLRQGNKGPAAARNNGINNSSGEYLLFLGDDTIPEMHLLEEHTRLLRNNPGSASIGMVRWHSASRNDSPLALKVSWVETDYSRIKDPGDCDFTYFCTANLGIPRSQLRDELFSEEFAYPAMEDVEFGYRLSRRGVRFILNTRAEVYHLHHYEEESLVKRQERVGLGVALLIKKHPELKKYFTGGKDACLSFLSAGLSRLPFIRMVNGDLYRSILALHHKYKGMRFAGKEN